MERWGFSKREGMGTILACLLLLLVPVVIAGISSAEVNRGAPRHSTAVQGIVQPELYEWARKQPVQKKKHTKKVAAARIEVPPVDCRVQKCIALTFDDGPAPTTTKLLDILRMQNAHATFFMLGMYAERHPDVVRRMSREGHQLGNHTWDHHLLTVMAPHDAKGEIDRAQEKITQIAGRHPTALRPPYGATNEMVAGQTGLPQILWSVDPYDWRDRDPRVIADRVVSAAIPGAIVLLHDVYPSTVEAVPVMIDHLHLHGYKIVTVDELFGGPPPWGEYRHQ